MPKTIFDSTDRAALLARAGRLEATAPARWGKFTAPRMVSHLISSARMALDEEAVAPRRSILSNRLVRYLVIYVMPFPRGAPTAPELLARAPDSWQADVAQLQALTERLAKNERGHWAAHPAFGDISPKDWGVLIYRHTSHHLSQFGV